MLDQMSEARLSSDLLQPASLMQAEKYSIFDAVSGGWNFQDGRNPENRNAFHAKTSILLLEVLKTPSLGARPSYQPPWRSGVLVFQGGPKAAQDVEKNRFLPPFFGRNFDSRPEPENSSFSAPRGGSGGPGSYILGGFLVILGSSPVLLRCMFWCLVVSTFFR